MNFSAITKLIFSKTDLIFGCKRTASQLAGKFTDAEILLNFSILRLILGFVEVNYHKILVLNTSEWRNVVAGLDFLIILMNMKKYKIIDLFCGCGGLTQGFFETKRFEIVFANDNDKAAIQSYQMNFDRHGRHADCRDIIDLVENTPELIPQADVVIGGPPCQGFSLLNRNRIGDKRRELWQYYMEVVRLSGARMVVMENVPQLLDSLEFSQILDELKKQGFQSITGHILNAANYGVPETRKRTILLASKDGTVCLPCPRNLEPERLAQVKKFHGFQAPKRWRTVAEVIGDLPEPIGTEIRHREAPPLNLHFGRTPTAISLERYQAVPPGGNRFDLQRNRPDITPQCWLKKQQGGTDLFGRLWWDRPSVTIRTEFFKPEKGRYLHPDRHRPITHREAARIQMFPDDFVFVGSKIEIAKQIGNAVPVGLAHAIAEEVISTLDGKNTTEKQNALRKVYRDWLGEKIKVEFDGQATEE